MSNLICLIIGCVVGLTVATLLIKAGYRVQMHKSKEGTAKYMYVLEIAR